MSEPIFEPNFLWLQSQMPLNAFRIKLFSKINRSEWDPKSDLLTKTQRPCMICPPPFSHSIFIPAWLWPLWHSSELSNLLGFTHLKPVYVFYFLCSFMAGHYPSLGFQEDLPDHLKVAFSLLLSLSPLFVSFIASPQFVIILYTCVHYVSFPKCKSTRQRHACLAYCGIQSI